MQIHAVDTGLLMALMLAGALFALAGLWLMFRPRVDGHAAVIKLLGMEVQASSAGLLVFLIGAGFLAVPIFVPEKQRAVAVAPAAKEPVPTSPSTSAGRISEPMGTTGLEAASSGVSVPVASEPAPLLQSTGVVLLPGLDAASSGVSVPAASEPAPASPSTGAGLLPPRVRATGVEVEPNDDYDQANQITLGGSIAGAVSSGDPEDWFVVPVEAPNSVTVRLRNLSSERKCRIHFYSAEERELRYSAEGRELRSYASLPAQHTVAQWNLEVGSTAAVFLRITSPFGATCRYELFTEAGAS